jgi:hypothetical protein
MSGLDVVELSRLQFALTALYAASPDGAVRIWKRFHGW